MKTKQTPALKTSTGGPNTPATTPSGPSGGPSKKNEKDAGVRIATAEFVAGAARSDQVPAPTHFDNAPEIAFAGRSNVGKSSLLNMVLARKGLARTSNTPGCTRQINFFDIGLAKPKTEYEAARPPRVIFVDLPGYGYAKVSKKEANAWKQLLEGYLHERTTLRGVCILVDVRRGLEQEEEDLIEFLLARPSLGKTDPDKPVDPPIQVFIAATKLDKISLSAQKPALQKLKSGTAQSGISGGLPIVATSAETGVGREALWQRIFDACRVHS
jgi:GTP-binding protein